MIVYGARSLVFSRVSTILRCAALSLPKLAEATKSRAKYQDLLGKGLESNYRKIWKRNKRASSSKFSIRQISSKAAGPNRPMIIFFGFLAGLAGGFGLAFVWDNLDTSFKRSDEITGYVNIPLLATIPALVTRGTVLDERRGAGNARLRIDCHLGRGNYLYPRIRPHVFLTSMEELYQSHFGLTHAPFNVTPDPGFLYLSTSHREALAQLSYGIKARKGFVVLTGEVGTGKTTLIHSLLNDFRGNAYRRWYSVPWLPLSICCVTFVKNSGLSS